VIQWLETFGVIGLAIATALLADHVARSRKYWITAYAISVILLSMIWLGRSHSALALIPPVSWISAGRAKFALVAVVPILLLWPLFCMTGNRRIRFFGATFLTLVVSFYAVWPFAASATNRRYLSSLPTRFDTNGICLQSTDYTCGPAAAVTALRHLGLSAGEGQIAIASHCSAAIGTPPDMLCRGLRSLYAADGLQCDLRYFSKLEHLPVGQPILAVIKYTFLEDHYVVILGMTPEYVLVADPNRGRMAYTHKVFLQRWRKLGIVLSRGGDSGRE
jgi:predicted double-glycine peptidase